MNRTSQADAALALAGLLTMHPQLDGNVYCPVGHFGQVHVYIGPSVGVDKRDALFADLVRILDAVPDVVLSLTGSSAWRCCGGDYYGVRFDVAAHYSEAEAALLHEQARSKHAEAAAAREVNEANAATDSQPFGSPVTAEVA
jgi:hypothetical protein